MSKRITVYRVHFQNKDTKEDIMGWETKVKPTEESNKEDRLYYNLPENVYELTVTEREVDEKRWQDGDD